MALPASDRDPSADPGVDFYRFANGGWLDANPIPAGYGAWGSFEASEEVRTKGAEEVVRVLRGDRPHYAANTIEYAR